MAFYHLVCNNALTWIVLLTVWTNMFTPNLGYCSYYPSNIFPNTHGFENWGISLDIPQF